jgi:hypothetical protein
MLTRGVHGAHCQSHSVCPAYQKERIRMGTILPRRFSSLFRGRPWWLLAGMLMLLALSATFASITAQTPGEVLDQQQIAMATTTIITDADPLDDTCNLRGQTFTAGFSGMLSRIELLLSRTNSPLNGSLPSDLTVELWAVSGGAPTGAPLATATIAAASVPTGFSTLVSAAFPSPAPAIIAGTSYAVTAHLATNVNNGSAYNFGITNADLYAGGTFVFSNCGALTFTVDSRFDLGFRTFVIPAPATPTATVTPAFVCPAGFECATPAPTATPATTVTPVATPAPTCPAGSECAMSRHPAQAMNGQN